MESEDQTFVKVSTRYQKLDGWSQDEMITVIVNANKTL